MRTAIFVAGALYPAHGIPAISGHVQTSLKTAEILTRHGHQVTFVTTRGPLHHRVPLPTGISELVTVTTVDVRTIAGVGQSPDMRIALRFFRELTALTHQYDFDVVHFFGGNLAAYLAGALKATRPKNCVLVSIVQYKKPAFLLYRLLERFLFPRVDHFIALCDWTRQELIAQGVTRISVTRPGTLARRSPGENRLVRIRADATDLVLFWRDADIMNGVDVCIDAFKSLSGEFPSVDFVFAVRRGHPFDDELRALDHQYRNIHAMFFPYPEGITIFDLMSSASCVVLPFRSLACDPQLAVLETLTAGAFLITTPVGSNRELLEGCEKACFVEPANIEETCSAIRYALTNKTEARALARKAKLHVAKKWNWHRYERGLLDTYAGALGKYGGCD